MAPDAGAQDRAQDLQHVVELMHAKGVVAVHITAAGVEVTRRDLDRQDDVQQIVERMQPHAVVGIRITHLGVEVTRVARRSDALPKRASSKATVSLREAAKRLGIGRSNTLSRLIKTERVLVVPWGKKKIRIPVVEIERLEREGFGKDKKRRRRLVRWPSAAHHAVPMTQAEVDAYIALRRSETITEMLARVKAARGQRK